MKSTPLYKEAKRLHALGFAIHWLHEKSKRPVESGWTSGPRKSWDYLKDTYNSKLNVGTRLGTPSKIGRGYLAVVDVDVKSTEKRHRVEAIRAAKQLLGASAEKCGIVSSGRGNGSRHYYCLTVSPFKTWNPAASVEKVKVHMPSKKPSKLELKELTDKEIGDGIRIANAWEISLYSDGRQVVLPPSIHPDSGQPYSWKKLVSSIDDLPLVQFPEHAVAPGGEAHAEPTKDKPGIRDQVKEIEFEDVPLEWVDIPDSIRDAIVNGKDVEDRSGYLLKATSALHSAGLTRDQILSVLTDPNTFLGACAYDHAKTKSRWAAAQWLWKYTVKKVLSEKSEAASILLNVPLPKFEAPKDDGRNNWRAELSRTGQDGQGPPRHTVENVVLILTNVVAPNIVRRNEFANRDAYGLDTPWGGKFGAAVTDDDIAKIKFWLGQRYHFEPADKVIQDALIVIATRNSYDPVIDWLDGLPAWDGTPRLDTWLVDHFEAEGDADYNAQVFRKWLVAMVMRAKRPGSKFDWMPIFEGPQGAGKSSFGRVLVGEEFFLDSLPNLADKDSALGLQGMWGVEMGELSNMRKTEIETVKAYVTRTIDKVRPPYGRRWLESPRRCVFFGTTNRSTYLTDDTGNRRFKPLKVGKLNFKRLRKEREQLFAEALFLFNDLSTKNELGLYFELTGKAREFETKIQGEKMVQDESHLMFEAMQDFLQKVEKSERQFQPEKFRILELFEGGGPLQKWKADNRNSQFAAKMLKKFGGEKRVIKGYSYWKIDWGEGVDPKPDTPDFY